MDLVEIPEHEVSQRHPWEQERFEFFLRVLASYLDRPTPRTVLDVGAGDAWFAGQLAARLPIERVVCWDTGYTPEFIGSRGNSGDSRVQLTVDRPAERFALLLLMDVLEHVADDHSLLASLVRENVAPDGRVLISVPAWPSLFSSHDVRLRHERRYTPAAGRELLVAAGLEILASAGLFHSLLLPRAVVVGRERLTGVAKPASDVGEWDAPALVTSVIRRILAFEGRLSLLEARLGWTIPGLSWWAICRRTYR